MATTPSEEGLEIVLASASPRRKWLLENAGYVVHCEVSGAEEIEDHSMSPADLALENAGRKARVVSARCQGALIVAADTVVYLDGRYYGKPTDAQDAFRMISELSGRTHEVVTGVVVQQASGSIFSFSESSLVTFRTLPADEIRRYLSSINPLDKAGAYAAQDDDGKIIASIQGSQTNVIGLPVERLRAELGARIR